MLIRVHAFQLAPTSPAAPTQVTAARSGSSAWVSWSDPSFDGGAAVTAYAVTTSPVTSTVTSTGENATISGLATGTSYAFYVRAINDVGGGPQSTATLVTATPDTSVDDAGTAAPVQEEPGINSDGTSVIAPVVKSMSSPATTTYSTSVWDAESSLAPTSLAVTSSTRSGTAALTGVVVDQNSNSPVAGAVVKATPAGGATTQTTTDSNGAYGFIDMPASTAGTSYTLSVQATGYGDFTELNDVYLADNTYQQTVPIGNVTQTYDESVPVAETAPTSAASSGGDQTGRYLSQRHIPPTIRVGFMTRQSNCSYIKVPGSNSQDLWMGVSRGLSVTS